MTEESASRRDPEDAASRPEAVGPLGDPGGSRSRRSGASNVGLALSLLLVVLVMVAAGLYAQRYQELPGEVAAFLGLTAVFPLTYLAYLGFAADGHRKRLEDDFRLLGLAREEDLSKTVSDLYETVYSPLQFVVYIALVVLISLVVFWGYLRCGAAAAHCPLGLDARTTSLVFYSYLGAYVFSVQELIRRFNTFDLQPQVYSSAAARMLIAVAVVFAAASIILSEGAQAPAGNGQTIWPAAAAFAVGVFPIQGLQWLARLGSRLVGPAAVERSELPLANILGISQWHEARLAQMGIDDAQNLAAVDIRRLLLTTQFDTQEIASWIDQAILYVKAGDKLARFREARITGNYALGRALADAAVDTPTPLEPQEREARTECRKRLALALALGQAEELDRLADNASFPNHFNIAEYYARSSQVVHERAAVGMSAVLGPIVEQLGADFAGRMSGSRTEADEQLRRHAAEILRLLGQNPRDALLWNTMGVAYYRLRRYDDALGAFDRAIALDRDLVEPYQHRSLVQIEQGRYDDAIRGCTEAIRLNPAHAEAFNNRGLAYMKLGYLDLALADLSEALRLDERLPGAHLNRGVTFNALARFADSLDDFRLVHLLDSGAAEVWLPWGLALIGAEDYPEALQKLTKAVILDTSPALARAHRGYVYYLLGQHAQARLDLEKALEIAPEMPAARSNLGLLEASEGKLDAAIEQYNQVLEAAPGEYVTRYNLALAYRRAGKKDEACAELKMVVATAPGGSVEAKNAHGWLALECGDDSA